MAAPHDCDEAMNVIFEGDACRQWLSELSKRLQRVVLTTNSCECDSRMADLRACQVALEQAYHSMDSFRRAARRFEPESEHA